MIASMGVSVTLRIPEVPGIKYPYITPVTNVFKILVYKN